MTNGGIDMSEDTAVSAPKQSGLDSILLLSALTFTSTIITGQIWVSGNTACVKFLGCGAGFFGYDALEHFLWGVLVVVFSIGICVKFPLLNLLHNDALWKNVLLLLAFLALVSVGWELLEYSHDHILTQFAFFNKLAFLKPQSLAQPSNVDTMGDLTFDLLGGALGILILKANLRINRSKTTNASESTNTYL